jgi:hypothetical protein
MKAAAAITRLRELQAQIIHGPKTFGEIADCLAETNELLELERATLAGEKKMHDFSLKALVAANARVEKMKELLKTALDDASNDGTWINEGAWREWSKEAAEALREP